MKNFSALTRIRMHRIIGWLAIISSLVLLIASYVFYTEVGIFSIALFTFIFLWGAYFKTTPKDSDYNIWAH